MRPNFTSFTMFKLPFSKVSFDRFFILKTLVCTFGKEKALIGGRGTVKYRERSLIALLALAPFMNLITFAERRQSARASSPGGEQWPHLNLVFVTSHYSHAATGNPFTKWERKYLLYFSLYIYLLFVCTPLAL